MADRLYRSESDRILGGVCGGIAEVYDMDPTLVRLVALLLVLGAGSGLLAYLIAWLIIPTESEVRGSNEEVDLTEESEEDEE
ncbi:MAG: PspC domain-containing protein [Candidatus Nanohaloarchaea archaeon]